MCSSHSSRGVALALAASLLAAPFALDAATSAADPARSAKQHFGFGKPATSAEISGWDIDVRPDGKGLPRGRGSVADGQLVYDAKCASCHGTFGESNDYLALAGGVGTLASDQPIRTTGSKLNHATTLWDYIYRAMPFPNPKTLSADEVYALTAYVLHLNDILPADATLDEGSILRVKMPNRDGFTTAHGLGSRDGKPDTHNVACMRDCTGPVKLASELPEHARDSHGKLSEQVRDIGPVGARPSKSPAAAPVGRPGGPASPETLARTAGCLACHGVANRVVGPGFREVRARYGEGPQVESRLAARVRDGGSGNWGSVPMPPHPQLAEGDIRSLVKWILSGAS